MASYPGLPTLASAFLADRDTSWFGKGLCRDYDPDWWYPVLPSGPEGPRYAAEVARAQEICDACPVKAECLKDAMDRNEQHGIWGGVDMSKRNSDRRLRAAKREMAA